MGRASTTNIVMDALSTATIGAPMLVQDFRHITAMLNMVVGGGEAVTIKFQGSAQKALPDFSAAQSASNQWDYIEVIDLEDGTAIDGDTGIPASGSNQDRVVAYNTDGLTWINAILSGITGSIAVTLKATGFDNK